MSKSALKALKCPQCGGDVDLDDKQKYGFCKYCGVKVQNTNFKVIKGEVRIIGNPTAENYMKLGKRYFDDENYKEALENFKKVLDIEPDNWEAIYGRGACIVKTGTFDDFRLKEIEKGAKNALKILENEKIVNELNQIKLDIANDIIITASNINKEMINQYNKNKEDEEEDDDYDSVPEKILKKSAMFVNNIITNAYDMKNSKVNNKNKKKISPVKDILNKITIVIEVAIYASELIEKIEDNNLKTTKSGKTKDKILISAYNLIFSSSDTACLIINEDDENDEGDMEYFDDTCEKYKEKLKKIDPNYKKNSNLKKGNGGCYVATCVYGSYDCPEVWTLRRYRDFKLSKTWYGRLFIQVYYLISPFVVKVFGKYNWFKNIWKSKLDKMVIKLQNKGYKSTSYNDK